MENKKDEAIVKTVSSNPAPLGLLGFGMTTVLLNLHNAQIIELSVVILAMGLAMGGLAQVIAGILEFKAGNTFGATAFTAYGHFWWSLVLILVNPPWLGSLTASKTSLGFYLILWCIFTFFMFIATFKSFVAKRFLFGTLTALFLLLALHNFLDSYMLGVIAGFEGIVCGSIALYIAVAEIVNGEFGRQVLPL